MSKRLTENEKTRRHDMVASARFGPDGACRNYGQIAEITGLTQGQVLAVILRASRLSGDPDAYLDLRTGHRRGPKREY